MVVSYATGVGHRIATSSRRRAQVAKEMIYVLPTNLLKKVP